MLDRTTDSARLLSLLQAVIAPLQNGNRDALLSLLVKRGVTELYTCSCRSSTHNFPGLSGLNVYESLVIVVGL